MRRRTSPRSRSTPPITGCKVQTSFRKWAAAAPDGFVFSVKGPRLVTQQKVLAETGSFIARFLSLRPRRAGRQARAGAVAIRAVQEIRSRRLRQVPRPSAARARRAEAQSRGRGRAMQSFGDAGFRQAPARQRRDRRLTPTPRAWPSIADLTGDVVYARLQRGDDTLAAAYQPKELDAWAERAKLWAKGGVPTDLPLVDAAHQARRQAARRLHLLHP